MRIAILALSSILALQAAVGPDVLPRPIPPVQPDLIASIARMAENPAIQAACQQRGLEIMNLTWEDTGRSKGSSVGPNISDLTIQPLYEPIVRPGGVQAQIARQPVLLPVIRFPNFADLTADVRIDDVKVLVGNHRGGPLQPVSLRTYLRDFRAYQHAPTGTMTGSLLADRDQVVLTSAQACILPIPASGSVRFAPVLFNYQSRVGAPAVLVILATPEGTSAQVVENRPDLSAGYAWGQRLYHNANGQRAGLLATRFSDLPRTRPAPAQRPAPQAAADGLSCVLVIQIPLIVVPPPELMPQGKEEASGPAMASAPAFKRDRGMEQAVVQAGPVEGPWLGLNGCHIERDQRFPIRATVQFYQATDTASLTTEDAERISKTIHRVYTAAETVGSLVVAGWTGRPTEADPSIVPPDPWPQPWYAEPCRAYEAATNRTWRDGLARIRARLGAEWTPTNARELANALTLVE